MLHGRAQQGKDPVALKAQWLYAFNLGRAAAGKVAVTDADVVFPFYGDVLEQLTHQLDGDDGGLLARGGDAADPIVQLQFEIAAELASQSMMTTEQVNAEFTGEVLERGPLNWEWVQAFLRVLDRTKLGDWSVQQFTRDAAAYLVNDTVRETVNDVVAYHVPLAEPCVWITHSLGSVIAYDILAKNSALSAVQLLTLGSPLGVNAIRKHLVSPLRMPAGVPKWANFYDERDVVPLFPLSSASGWALTPPIENLEVVNPVSTDPHSVVGYVSEITFSRYAQ